MKLDEKRNVYCFECMFIGKPSGAKYEPHPKSACLCWELVEVNHVTGDYNSPLCRRVNYNGNCEHFEEKATLKTQGPVGNEADVIKEVPVRWEDSENPLVKAELAHAKQHVDLWNRINELEQKAERVFNGEK